MQELINEYPLAFIALVLILFIGYLRALYKHLSKRKK